MTVMEMRTRTLLSQVLAVNTGLVAATALVAAVLGPAGFAAPSRALLIGMAVAMAVLGNSLLLRRRLAPLDRLLQTMERVDLASPGQRACAPENAPREIEALTADFNRMLERLEVERLNAGRAVLRAQEEERARIAQDLHDEVNQALTGILLRLQATISDAPAGLQDELQGTKELATQAMEELLTLARQLRPTALDDHGLVPALASQVADFGERTGIRASFHRHGDTPELSDEEQLVLYRVTQESLSNVVQHAQASRVDVELCSIGRTMRRVRARGGTPAARPRRRVRLHQRPARQRARPSRPLRHARARAARRGPPEHLLR